MMAPAAGMPTVSFARLPGQEWTLQRGIDSNASATEKVS